MSSSRIALVLAALAAVVLGMVAYPPSGVAHLALVDTEPADGASSDAPVERVVLRFSVAGKLVGPGIRILNEQGEAVTASVRESADGTTFEATPAAALEGGRFGVAWRVAAPDAHPISDAFTFAVAAASAAGPTPESDEAASAPRPPGATGGGDTQPTVNASDVDSPLTRALEAPDDRGAKVVSGVGRALGYAGGLLAIGGLAFAAVAAVGTRRELTRLFSAVRLAGAVALLGGAIGLVGRTWLLEGGGLASAFSGSAVRDALEGEAGLSLALTAAGGLLVALAARTAFRPAPRVAIDAGSWESNRATRIVGGSIRNARLAVVGAAIIAVGAALDGHSASEGPRVLVWSADLAHTLGAGVWFGGLVFLAGLLFARRRAGRPANAAYSAVRFSTLAGAGLTVAGVAGVALAIVVLPEPSALWESTWGLLLIAKVALVALVATVGGYNHFWLIPRLSALLETARLTGEGRPDDEPLTFGHGGAVGVAALPRQEAPAVASSPTDEQIAQKLRRNAVAEVALLVAVVALTAALVGASAA